MGLQTGARRQEWAQDRTALKQDFHVHLNVDGPLTAFTEFDFEYCGHNGLRLPTDSLPLLDIISTTRVKWRYQKNVDNSQVIAYAKDSTFPKLCVVAASHRIISRARRQIPLRSWDKTWDKKNYFYLVYEKEGFRYVQCKNKCEKIRTAISDPLWSWTDFVTSYKWCNNPNCSGIDDNVWLGFILVQCARYFFHGEI